MAFLSHFCRALLSANGNCNYYDYIYDVDDGDYDDDDDDDYDAVDDDDVDDDDDDNVIQGLSLTQPVLAKGRKSGRAKQSLYWRPMIANISLPASLPFHKSKPWKYFSNRHQRCADREMIDSDESGEM